MSAEGRAGWDGVARMRVGSALGERGAQETLPEAGGGRKFSRPGCNAAAALLSVPRLNLQPVARVLRFSISHLFHR